MDIWDQLYLEAKQHYHPTEVNKFIYTNHVVCAIQSINNKIYSGYCIEGTGGTMNLCAERVAALAMYMDQGETGIKRLIVFRDEPPCGVGGMPCGTCREFLMQLSTQNAELEIMIDFEKREVITLGELLPNWWGYARISE
jgi:cytidine deaminase